MKHSAAIEATLPLPGVKRPAGRPRKADALSNAERQRRFRQRRKALISVTKTDDVLATTKGQPAISVTRNENSSVWIRKTRIGGWSVVVDGTESDARTYFWKSDAEAEAKRWKAQEA
jgi:hypothetical protein